MTETDAAETQTGASRPPRSPRGTSFPRMPLADAVQAVKEIAKAGNRHTPASMASVLGHSSANSGAFRQKLADLREFDLITGGGDDLALSGLAMKIAYPTSPTAADAAIHDAFLNCSSFAQMYNDMAKGESLALETICNLAIHKLGVAQHVADRFAACFAEGAVAAQVGERHGHNITLWAPDRGESVAATEAPIPGRAKSGEPIASAPEDTLLALRQVWNLPAGAVELSIRVPDALPASAFQLLGEAVASVEQLVRHLDQALPGAEPSGPSEG